MKNFEIKVKGKDGVVRTSEVMAKSKEEAERLGRRNGRVVGVRPKMNFGFGRAMSQEDRQVFFARLSAMLASRVGTSDALKLLRDTFSGKIQEVSGRLLTYVEGGEDLAGAIGRVGSPDFPENTIALIQAGSRSGETWRALKDASQFEYQLALVRRGAAKGLWMGVGSFLFAAITVVVSTVYVGPKIMGSDLMMSIAADGGGVDIGWVNTAGNIIGWMMGVLLVIGMLMWMLASLGRRIMPLQADKLIMKIPFYKDLVLARNNYITLYGLALLIRSGVRTEEALRLTAEAAPKGALRRDLVNATLAVKTGRPWASALETFHATDRAALSSAVDREQISTTLDALSSQYRELYAQRLGSFVPMLNLLSALFLSLAGGILFAQSILPMLLATQEML
jgi:general secretion pathway protein F